MRTFHPLQVVLCFFLCLMALSRLVWMQLHPYSAEASAPALSLMHQTQQGMHCSSLDAVNQAHPEKVPSSFYQGPLSFFYMGFLAVKCEWGDFFTLEDLMRDNLWLIVGMCILVMFWMRLLLGLWLPSCILAVILLFRNALVSRIYLVSLQPWASLLLLFLLVSLTLAMYSKYRKWWTWGLCFFMLAVWGGYGNLGASTIDFPKLNQADFWVRWMTPMIECMDLQYGCSFICMLSMLVMRSPPPLFRKSLQQFFGICLFLFGYSLIASLQEGEIFTDTWNMVVVVEPLVIVYGAASLFQWILPFSSVEESPYTPSVGKV